MKLKTIRKHREEKNLSTRRKFATTKIGKHPKEIKAKHIVNGRLNQISLTYKTGKNKFTVSVIVKNKKDLKRKIKTLLNFPQNSGDIAKTKFISVERYLVRKKEKMIKFSIDVLRYDELVWLFHDMNIRYNVTPPVINEQVNITIIDIDIDKLFLFMRVIQNKQIYLNDYKK